MADSKFRGHFLIERELERIHGQLPELLVLMIDGSSKQLSDFFERKDIVTFDPVNGF